MSTGVIVDPNIEYPEDDGLPMSDNSKQFRWIVNIEANLGAIFADDPNVFVAGNMLWYPVEGQPSIRLAPDVFVVFARPKGDRSSYQQWTEDDTPITVVFEILSPGNRADVMDNKKRFYEKYGVEEYYVYDPHSCELDGFLREDERFVAIPTMNGWTSPLLGIRFDLSGGELVVFDPDGNPFRDRSEAIIGERRVKKELEASNRRERAAKRRADAEKRRAEEERRRAEEATQHAQAEKQHAEAEKQHAQAEKQRADRLAEKLRQMGIDPDA
jgi:Uma2 family endonuclease